MNAEEIAALASGAALAMTPAQHASMQAALASFYARGPGETDVEDGAGGSACGCSGNPSPSAQAPAVTPPAQAPAVTPPAQAPAVTPPAQAPAVTPPAQAPAVTTTTTEVSENAPGNTVHTGSINGGTVTLRH